MHHDAQALSTCERQSTFPLIFTREAVVGGEPAGPGPVAEPAQREERLAPSGELPAAGRGAAAAALGGEQPGQAAKQFRGNVEHGTIGDQVESWW